MTDSSGAILKIVTALTSFKTAIKFISMGMIWIFYPKIVSLSNYSNADFSKNDLAIILMILGMGSIIGELLYYFLSKIGSVTIYKYINHKKLLLEEKEKKIKNEKFLISFKELYELFDGRSKHILKELAKGKKEFSHEYDEYVTLQGLTSKKYIRQCIQLEEHFAIYELNPCLKDYLLEESKREFEEIKNTFNSEGNSERKFTLEMLGNELDVLTNDDIKIIKKFCNKFSKIFYCREIYKDDDWEKPMTGLNVYVLEQYRDFLSEEFGVITYEKEFSLK